LQKATSSQQSVARDKRPETSDQLPAFPPLI